MGTTEAFTRTRSMLCMVVVIMMIIEGVWIRVVMGEVYRVGEADGWTTLPSSNYYDWASTKNFRVGDVLLFQYNTANHNVLQVSRSDFRSCNTTFPMRTYDSGNDSYTILGPGHYYFICSFPGHCDAGQKLDVRVLKTYHLTTASPLTSPPPAAAPGGATPPYAMAPAPSPAVGVAASALDHKWLLRSTVAVSLIGLAIYVA